MSAEVRKSNGTPGFYKVSDDGGSLTSSLDSTTGLPVADLSTGQAKHVVVGNAGQARNRDLPAVATTVVPATNTTTFPSPGVTEVTIIDNPLATGSVTGLRVVFDAPNDVIAAAWLADIGSVTSDSQYTMIKNQDRQTYLFASPITRIDFLAYGAAHRVIVEAV